GERLILAIGRLSSEKGHADLVEAFARLRRHRPDLPVRLAIVGGGPESQRLDALARELGIRSRVKLLGGVYPAHPLYGAADLAVLPSHSEGSPNALLEAAAHRVPIIATLVGGVPDTWRHGYDALLVAPRAPVALA